MKIVLAYFRRPRDIDHPPLVKRNYQTEIMAFCADIGREEELEG